MMSRTHLAVGMAAALAVCRPDNLGGIFAAVIGGASGGVFCDIECDAGQPMRDALLGRMNAGGITAVLLAADWLLKTGVWAGILSQSAASLGTGLVAFIITFLIGRLCRHRGFTHSLLFVFLISYGLFCFSPDIGIPALIGGLSHLLLDTLNKKPVPWFFPIGRGFCLRLFYANRTANTVFLWAGFAASVALITWRLISLGHIGG
ncbi:MAG: metal-dependent hydrolase [Clostridia bacterium]|nr:metal-dependent hydrolase [Clostridia bacterium]